MIFQFRSIDISPYVNNDLRARGGGLGEWVLLGYNGPTPDVHIDGVKWGTERRPLTAGRDGLTRHQLVPHGIGEVGRHRGLTLKTTSENNKTYENQSMIFISLFYFITLSR